jgi:sugar lactone lactonase YvrE
MAMGTADARAHAVPLKTAITLPNAITNGVAIAPDGRTFLVIAKQKGQDVPQLAEYVGGQLKPYPDASWNAWKPGEDGAKKFQHVNSVRFGPDGTLWIVDIGSPEMGKPVVPHGPKLVGVNITTGKVVDATYLDSVTKPESFIDDVRFNGEYAYLTDAGWPGLIVMKQKTGEMWRALNNDASTTARKPLTAEGRSLVDPNGKPIVIHADQLEVSPDGKLLYFQPCSGPLAVIETKYLERQVSDEERSKHVRQFATNGSAGGTAIDAKGNIYISDTDHYRILKITPAGKISTLVEDKRLDWVDAMWITADGSLWMPAAQLNRTAGLNGGKMEVQFPMMVYTVDIGIGPPMSDHR